MIDAFVNAAFTVSVVEPVTDPCVAVIVEDPAPTLVASPGVPAALLIVATLVADDDQVTVLVMVWMLPSEYVPVAVNCWLVPNVTEGIGGSTVIETKVGGAVVTVRSVDPTIFPEVALIVLVPAASALASPCMPAALLIVATLELVELQVTDGVRLYVSPVLNVPVAVNCCVLPAATDGFAGVIAIEVNPAVDPVPLRLVVCGLLPALSVTVSVPVRVPTTVGVNVTLIVHFALLATAVPQVLVCAKSPVTLTLSIVNAAVILFVNVTVVGLLVVPTVRLLNVTVAGDSVTACTPVPLRLTVCGLLLALSVMVTAPVAAPVVVGENVTEIVHFLPAFSELPHVFVSAKLPLTAMLVMVRVAEPELVRITFFAALVVFTTTLPKFREVGESVTAWPDAAGMKKNANTKAATTQNTAPCCPWIFFLKAFSA